MEISLAAVVVSSTIPEIFSNAPTTSRANADPACTCRDPSSEATIVAFVSAWICVTIDWICPADSCDRSANFRISAATTANPRPCSPARAASIAAFNANKFV